MTRGDSKKQMGVALPDYLRVELAAASAAANVSIAEEIRRRLDMSFEYDALDDETQDLVSVAIWIATDITNQLGTYWHVTQQGRRAVAAGIRLYIETLVPPPQVADRALLDPDDPEIGPYDPEIGLDDPETLGRASARHYQQQQVKQPQDAARPRRWGKR